MDWIRVGVSGGLADYSFVDRFGNTVAGRQIDYNGQPAGYTADPQETINYVEAHDNETLFDAIQVKAPIGTSMADRVRMQDLGMSLLGFSQGIPFFHAGVDLLRSKSLDGNSYNSGDWFNRLDFTDQTNNWGVGLPPARDNQSNWPIMQPLLGNPALAPASTDIRDASAHFREVLAIRKSSPLLRRIGYRLFRNPLVMFGIGPIYSMILAPRWAPLSSRRRVLRSVYGTDLALAVLVGGLCWLIGWREFLLIQGPVALLAGSVGVWLFYVQHQFEDTYWQSAERWSYADAALRGSSYLKLPKVLQFFTGVLSAGQGRVLLAKLSAAERDLRHGAARPGAGELHAFLQQVEAWDHARILTEAQADALAEEARAILALIGDDGR